MIGLCFRHLFTHETVTFQQRLESLVFNGTQQFDTSGLTSLLRSYPYRLNAVKAVLWFTALTDSEQVRWPR